MSATHPANCITNPASLYVALEMGFSQWKVACTIGLGQKPRVRTIEARDVDSVLEEIRRAKRRFGLPEDAPVHSCYEAGRDGFWVHRFLGERGLDNVIVDSSSIEVNRRRRRAKTDRLDAEKLVTMLVRYHEGEKRLWSVVQVPSLEDEDARQLHRELMALKGERTRHINRIKGLLIGEGIAIRRVDRRFPEQLKRLRLWWDGKEDGLGSPLPSGLRARLLREYERLELVEGQIRELEKQRAEAIGRSKEARMEKVRKLMNLRGIGATTAWLYTMEFFGWRDFRNRREVGSLAGLTPTPYRSCGGEREQGISKAGNRRLRVTAIEIAWGWLHFQPQSELSRWYRRRFAAGSKRQRKIGIVALARKLLVALWQYLETGVPPAGAVVGDWRSKIPRTLIAEP